MSRSRSSFINSSVGRRVVGVFHSPRANTYRNTYLHTCMCVNVCLDCCYIFPENPIKRISCRIRYETNGSVWDYLHCSPSRSYLQAQSFSSAFKDLLAQKSVSLTKTCTKYDTIVCEIKQILVISMICPARRFMKLLRYIFSKIAVVLIHLPPKPFASLELKIIVKFFYY